MDNSERKAKAEKELSNINIHLSKGVYLPADEHPLEIKISKYVKHGRGMVLREALDEDHPDNLYNWFRKEYPKLDPSFYGIKNPTVVKIEEEYSKLNREELIALAYSLEKELEKLYRSGL